MPMLRPNEQTLRTILRNQESNKDIAEWLEAELSSLNTKLYLTADDTSLKWNQGRAQSISELLDYLTNTRDHLEKIGGK